MIRKTIAALAIAGLCAFGSAGVASASAGQAEPAATPSAAPWIPLFYFGTQTYCTQAGVVGQQTGALKPGGWMCDSGWLLVQPL
jgi:hypothetical protein